MIITEDNDKRSGCRSIFTTSNLNQFNFSFLEMSSPFPALLKMSSVDSHEKHIFCFITISQHSKQIPAWISSTLVFPPTQSVWIFFFLFLKRISENWVSHMCYNIIYINCSETLIPNSKKNVMLTHNSTLDVMIWF